MSTLDAGLGDTDLPTVFRAANEGSLSGQHGYLRGTRVRLLLVVLAAIAGAAAARARPHTAELKTFGAIAVACFILAFATEIGLLVRRPEELWYHGRAMAESSKTLAWSYAMRADPFAADGTTPDADARMIDRLKDLLTESPIAGDLPPITGDQITGQMRELRAASLDQRKRAYLQGRVGEQAEWYAAKARFNKRRASAWRILLVIFELAGALSALLVLIEVTTLGLDGVFASMVAAAGAWLEVRQFDNLASAYTLTASELALARADADFISDEAAWSGYVSSTEQAISREHTMWLARRVKPHLGKRRGNDN